jgi:hypothetical protein
LPRLAFTALVLALIGGATAAFAITEALKLERPPVGKARAREYFSPTCECRTSAARIAFTLRQADQIDAVVVDSDGQPVRTLAVGDERDAGRVVFGWDGRTDVGALAPDGAYRLRLRLSGDGRTIVVRDVFRLDTIAPTAELVSMMPRTLPRAGAGRRDSATLTVTVSEPARPVVLVDGSIAERGQRIAARTADVAWTGSRRGDPLPPGSYVVAVRARDRAGNVSAPSSGLTVRIRYVELARDSYRARRGGVLRFRVSSDTERIGWQIVRRSRVVLSGRAEPGRIVTRLPARIRPGRYVLRADANGYTARAPLSIRPS